MLCVTMKKLCCVNLALYAFYSKSLSLVQFFLNALVSFLVNLAVYLSYELSTDRWHLLKQLRNCRCNCSCKRFFSSTCWWASLWSPSQPSTSAMHSLPEGDRYWNNPGCNFTIFVGSNLLVSFLVKPVAAIYLSYAFSIPTGGRYSTRQKLFVSSCIFFVYSGRDASHPEICFLIHSHISWPRSGDCGGSWIWTRDHCVLSLVSPSWLNHWATSSCTYRIYWYLLYKLSFLISFYCKVNFSHLSRIYLLYQQVAVL
jgi:hypothetical protein